MEKQYNITQMSKLLGVSVKTLQRWDREGIMVSRRSPTNRRFYTHTQYLEKINSEKTNKKNKRKNIIYARVDTEKQMDDLEKQVSLLEKYAVSKGISIDETIKELGNGLNYKREKWNILLDAVLDGEIKNIYLVDKERFVGVGFEWFEKMCKKFGTNIIVVHNHYC